VLCTASEKSHILRDPTEHIAPVAAAPPTPALPTTPYGVEPKILKLHESGKLVLSTGRPGLFVWVANDPPVDGWTPFNVAEHHNEVNKQSNTQIIKQTKKNKHQMAVEKMPLGLKNERVCHCIDSPF